jgi:Subtilase family
MDPVTSSQFLALKNSFARDNVDVEIAYTPTGDIDYMYVVGRLLARADNVERLQTVMPGLGRADPDEQPETGDLVMLSLDRASFGRAEAGSMTVPDALDFLDENLEDNQALAGGEPLMSPVHIVHITKICPAGEPEVPSGYPTSPWPPPNPAGGGKGVRVGISDTGLQPGATAAHAWLANVAGDPEPLGPILPSGQQSIPKYAGHGTFGAGVAACMAPGADVYVNDHFTSSGGEREDVIIQKLEQLIATDPPPDVVCLPAGTYTRKNWLPLSFSYFHEKHPDITLVASAGNESTNREFYPAAFPWVVAVGALATDQQHRAWFSNYGDWVDVYALGEGMVNAFATGLYTYQEPPKQPAQETFDGMAEWQGTSFSAPLVAGLIAEQMANSGMPAAAATQAVLERAQAHAIPGVGPALSLRPSSDS